MSNSDFDDSTPLLHNYGIPTPIRDDRKDYQKRLAVYLILTSILFERIAFYTLAANLALGLNSDTQSFSKTENPAILTFIFLGTSHIFALIFAAITDAKLGRVKAIFVGFFLYTIGYTLITVCTNPLIDICSVNQSASSDSQYTWRVSERACNGLIGTALIVIAIGAGAVQSNMAVFGAEQIQESKLTSRFFDKYVIVNNIGAMVAMFTVASIDPENKSYFIGYLIATVMLFFAAILFLFGRRYFIYVKPYDTIITKCFPVVLNAFQSCYKHKMKRRSEEHELTAFSKQNLSRIPHDLRERESVVYDRPRLAFLDFAKAANNGKYIGRIVNDVKAFGNALMVFILLIPYWLIYNQINSTFRQQTQAMKGWDNRYKLIIVSLIDPITIIVTIIISNLCVCYQTNGRNWSSIVMIKFLLGMFFACFTMCIAGSIEKVRQGSWRENERQSDLSILAQIPQDIGMGISEYLIMVASFEFAYFAAPRSAQSLFMSSRFFFIGVSSLIGASSVALLPASTQDLNFSHRSETDSWIFYDYFFILGGLQLILIPIFYFCQKKYHIIKLNPQQIEINQFYRREPS